MSSSAPPRGISEGREHFKTINIVLNNYCELELLLELRIESLLDGFGFHFWMRAWHQVNLDEGVRLSERVHLLEVFTLDDCDLDLTLGVIVAHL